MSQVKIARGVKSVALATLLIAGTSSFLNAESAKKIFDSGFRNALKVLKYEKELSVNKAKVGREDYCVALYRTTDMPIRPFDAMKMESLSLNMGYNPAYLTYDSYGENKNIFCFVLSKEEKNASSALKEIRSRYPKIDNFSPMIVKLYPKFKYKRSIPFLGVLDDVTTESTTLLSNEIKRKNEVIANQKKEISKLNSKIKTLNDKIDSLAEANAISKKQDEESKAVDRDAREKVDISKLRLPNGVKKVGDGKSVYVIDKK